MKFKKGNVPWMKGRHHAEETKQILREKALKQFENGISEETRKKLKLSHTGYVIPKATRKKMSLAAMGQIPWNKGKKGLQIGWNKNIPCSEKTKQKISDANKGKPSWIKGKHHTEKSRKKMSERQLGKKNHFYGKHLTTGHKQKISLSNTGKSGYWEGKHLTASHKENLRFANIDWDFYNEHGCLKTNYPYNDCFTEHFKDMIRARDDYKCVVTGMTNEEHKGKYGRALNVHHWTYDKDVTNPFYFVTVTCGINTMAGTNRGEWIDMFNGMMEDKYCEMMQIDSQTTVEH